MHLLLSNTLITQGSWSFTLSITESQSHAQFLGYRLQIKCTESLLRLQEGCNFYWERLIGPGLAWIAPLKITDINSCMAAIQPDTSTCLACEQTAIRKKKIPKCLISLLPLNCFLFCRQLFPSATVFILCTFTANPVHHQGSPVHNWCHSHNAYHMLSGTVAGRQGYPALSLFYLFLPPTVSHSENLHPSHLWE